MDACYTFHWDTGSKAVSSTNGKNKYSPWDMPRQLLVYSSLALHASLVTPHNGSIGPNRTLWIDRDGKNSSLEAYLVIQL